MQLTIDPEHIASQAALSACEIAQQADQNFSSGRADLAASFLGMAIQHAPFNPEYLVRCAFARLRQAVPDVTGALANTNAASALRPDWYYRCVICPL